MTAPPSDLTLLTQLHEARQRLREAHFAGDQAAIDAAFDAVFLLSEQAQRRGLLSEQIQLEE